MTSTPSPSPTLPSTLRAVWTLLFGIGLLWMANGLQNSLLGIRAEAEGFEPAVIGLIMSGFFVGLLVGSLWTPKAVRVVGHVRVFAAMAAVASVAILLHALLIDELGWWVIRCITGFCYAGIIVVVESWLNERSPRAVRGQILAFYMTISFGAAAGSQLLLNLASARETALFMVVSILISLAVVPLLLHATTPPAVDSARRVSLRELVAASPLGAFGMFIAGLANGTVFGMAAVYARGAGFSIAETGLFVALLTIGAAVMQWPVGRLSDRFDRRRIMAAVSVMAACASVVASGIEGVDSVGTIVLVTVTGGLALSIHSLSLAYTNDHLEPEQMVGASSGLLLLLGIGSVIGPVVAGVALALLGSAGYFLWLASTHAAFALFALWRMSRRASPSADVHTPFVVTPFPTTDIATAFAEPATEPESGKGDA